jgi:hypothetical protein
MITTTNTTATITTTTTTTNPITLSLSLFPLLPLLDSLQDYSHKEICEIFNWLETHSKSACIKAYDLPKLCFDTTIL